jgi:membrane-associated phospholipid phosphatase
VASLLLVVVAWHSAPGSAEGVRWGMIAALFAGLVPMAYIVGQVRRRRLSDRHVGVREQRRVPLLVGIVSVLLGIGVLVLGQAPRDLVALVAAMAVGLATSLLVTLAWKISIHVAVVAGAVTILTLVFGPAALMLAPLVVLVGWARVALHDHTPAQTVAGAALGALVAASVFSLLR